MTYFWIGLLPSWKQEAKMKEWVKGVLIHVFLSFLLWFLPTHGNWKKFERPFRQLGVRRVVIVGVER